MLQVDAAGDLLGSGDCFLDWGGGQTVQFDFTGRLEESGESSGEVAVDMEWGSSTSVEFSGQVEGDVLTLAWIFDLHMIELDGRVVASR